MCFSAAASFVGGAVLTSIGILSIRKNNQPSQRLFAAVPFVFGIQQIAEGFVWTALQSSGQQLMLTLATYVFLFTALVVWSTVLPLSILLMEKDQTRRRILRVFLAVGIVASLYHLVAMFLVSVSAQISSFHIKYLVATPDELMIAASLAYLIATILPIFTSSNKKMIYFGIIILVSYLVAFIFYLEYLTSVWCFFAALASVVILRIVSSPVQEETQLESEQNVLGI